MQELDERRRELKETFTKARGYWSNVWDDLLDRDPDFFESYLNFSSVPWRRNGGLPPKVREFCYIAIDASTTHLYGAGTRVHIDNALSYGATAEEIMEVFELTSVLGVHSCTLGVPVLMEELEAAGRGDEIATDLTPEQQALKEAFIETRGYWSPLWDAVLAISPDYFAAYKEFSGVPWEKGPLEPKVKELIYIAIDASTTHLYEPGLRVHIRNALRYGATAKEIMEVFELISVLGIHTCTDSVPILTEALAARERQAAQ